MKMKRLKICMSMCLLLAGFVTVNAQSADEKDYKTLPHMFVGIQGGVQNTFNSEFNNLKTFTPTMSLSVGRFFTPVIGARLHFNGAWSKSGVNYRLADDARYNYNYITGGADVLVNLCTAFGKKDWYPVNLYFIGGLGGNYAFENYGRSEEKAMGSSMMYADNDDRWAFNGRVGLGLEVPIVKWLSFTLEGDLNARFAGKNEVFNDDVLQMTAQAGLNFKFGYKKEKAVEDVDITPTIPTRPVSNIERLPGTTTSPLVSERRNEVLTKEDLEENGHKLPPYFFVGLQGGVQNTFNKEFNNWKTFTPTASISIGRMFSPVVGARLHFNGVWDKSGVNYPLQNEDGHYNYNYVTGSADALVNLCTLFGKKRWYPVNLFFIGGLGANYAFENAGNCEAVAAGSSMMYADNDHRWAFNGRVGLGLEVPIVKWLSFTIESDLNARFAGKSEVFNDDVLQMTAQAGLNFKFGYKKPKAIEDQVTTPVIETRGLTLYEQMLNTVDNRMNVWMKRLNGESKADFLARTSDEAIKTQRLEFTKQVSTEMANDRANSTVRDLQYNSAAQQLGVQFTDMPSITLRVPKDDIKSIKGKGDLQFTNTVYNLNPGDKFEVLYTEVLNPSTGKKYTYVSTRDAKFVPGDGYMPLSAVQQDIVNNERLQAVATDMVREAKEKSILSDNTTVTVKAEPVPAANGKTDYKVTYTYDVKEGFSVKDDFGPGKYEAEKSAASVVMLNIIKQTLNEDFAKYIKRGNTVDIKLKGSADASPIRGKIAYNNQYGDIKDKSVKVNGKEQKMTVTKATGITSNEQLSLVRAISVKNYIVNNVDALKGAKVNDSYEVEVSSDEGSQFRRVAVDFLFHDAF